MGAIALAAGLSSRLRPLTEAVPMRLLPIRDLLDRETTVLFSDSLVTPPLMDRCVCDPSDFALLIDADRSIPRTMRARLAADGRRLGTADRPQA